MADFNQAHVTLSPKPRPEQLLERLTSGLCQSSFNESPGSVTRKQSTKNDREAHLEAASQLPVGRDKPVAPRSFTVKTPKIRTAQQQAGTLSCAGLLDGGAATNKTC